MSTPILAMIPSGRKATKLYSVLPTDGTGDFDFTRASSATRVNSEGLIESVLANLPRLDYLGSSCPRLLLEPQRTNLALYSEQTDNAYWGQYQCTITANDTTSPDGYTNADKLTNTISTGSGVVYKSLTSISAGAQTMSFFIKAGTGSVGRLACFDGTSTFSADYNLTSGTASNVTAGATTSMSDYGNGWWRCTLTATSVAGTHYLDYGIVNSALGQYAYIYGLQFESVAAYATSYIPTLGAAVTRVAETCSGAGNDQVINSTEGVIYWEANSFLNQEGILELRGTNADYIYIYFTSIGTISIYSQSGWVLQVNNTVSYPVSVGFHKYAFKYGNNNHALWVDGVEVISNATIGNKLVPAFLSSCNFTYYSNTKDARLYNTALTDGELATLTTL